MKNVLNQQTRAPSQTENLSVLGRQWCVKTPDERQVLRVMQQWSVPEIIARILVNRDIPFEQLASFIDPKIRQLLPDPLTFKDMQKAILRMLTAIEKKEKVIVYADYDVDGATSSAILKQYFSDIHFDIDVFIPDRFDDGYGPNFRAIQSLHEKGYTLIIFVDSGTAAIDIFQKTSDAFPALDIIVLDHHLGQPTLPPVHALVNPNRFDEDNPFSYLCAAGLSFLFITGIQSFLKQKQPDNLYPNLLKYLDLVALGTVCDVMPLLGLNRAFVKQGLKIAAKRQNIGLKKLADVAKVSEMISVYHLGFLLGPRINAGGRIGKSYLGSKLLSTKDDVEAEVIAEELNQLNLQRQAIETVILDEAIQKVETLYKNDVTLVVDGDWHQGIIGIVASRLKEKYERPVCVISTDSSQKGLIAKGSGRSISKFDLGRTIHSAVSQKYLENGGGHQMAVGFSILPEKIDDFRAFLNEQFLSRGPSSIRTYYADGTLSPSGIHLQLCDSLAMIEPFGQGNPTPKFIVGPIHTSYWERVGNGHLKCYFVDEFGERFEAIAFRSAGTKLEDYLTRKVKGTLCSIVGQVKKDTWNGKDKVSFILEDIIPA